MTAGHGVSNGLTAGVLGGLGPEATLDFYARVIRRAGAATDQDHIRVIIDSNPHVPNRNDAIAGRGESPGPHLARMAAGLERAGADFLVMACNAAHAWQGEIEAATTLPFVSIVDETVAATVERFPGVRRVGLLAADGTLDSGLYQHAFGTVGLEAIHADRPEFMRLLYRIKAGDTGPDVRRGMRELAAELGRAGAEVLIAACTEVPLVLSPADCERPLIDSTEVLADAVIAIARGLRPARREAWR